MSAPGVEASELESDSAVYYIAATGPVSRARRVLKQNDAFLILDSLGDIGVSTGGADGLFVADTRHLAQLELLCQGVRPLLLGSATTDDGIALTVELTNPDYFADGALLLAKDTVHISRYFYLLDEGLHHRMSIVNYGAEAVDLSFTLTFDNDFADIFEVRGMNRKHRGRIRRAVVGPSQVIFSYHGLDDQPRASTMDFFPEPTSLMATAATFAVHLEPHQRHAIAFTCRQGALSACAPRRASGLKMVRRSRSEAAGRMASIETESSSVNEILAQASTDLGMLMTSTPDGPYPYAGVPWYSTTFGRDGLVTALELLWLDPGIALGVLRRLARLQAVEASAFSDAEPGKIIHEMRHGEMAALGEVPFGRYYGSVDATPLFVMLAGAYLQRTGNLAVIRDIWPAIDRALAWTTVLADRDGDGFIEYQRSGDKGLANQGWKDSFDAIFHADGRLATGPIALVEPQAYAYAAAEAGALCARSLRMPERAEALEAFAAAMRERFLKSFWCQPIQMYALALDGEKRPCAVRSTNSAHALYTGLATDTHAALIAAQLRSSRFFSGWGVRTIAEGESRYNPMSYHNGSIWPHDNAIVASGLSRYGHTRLAERLFDALLAAARYFDHRRIPELYCGFPRKPGRGPVLYPVACAPHAWSAGAPFMMLNAILGLRIDAAHNAIELVNPIVPAATGSITVKNLAVGSSHVDFTVREERGEASLKILRSTGPVRVSLSMIETANG